MVHRNWKDSQRIVVENRILHNSIEVKNDPVNLLLTTQPNSRILGVPLRLFLFERAHPNPEVLFQQWVEKKPNRKNRMSKWLSEKQIFALERNVVKFHQWLKKVGEPPALENDLAIANSERRIIQYYKNKGYFDASVTTKKMPLEDQKIALIYQINPQKKYRIDSIDLKAESEAIQTLYKKNKEQQWIEPGAPFEVQNFDKERDRLITLFKNNGVYNFQQSSLKFIAAIDSTGKDLTIPITVEVKNPTSRINDTLRTIPYQINTVDKINIYVNNLQDGNPFQQFSDSLQYDGYTIFSQGKLKYNPRALTSGIMIQQKKPYSEEERTATYRYFTNLKNFKYPSITYTPIKSDSSALKALVYLTPKERFSLDFDLDLSHSNIQDFGIGLGGGLGIRNVFKGAALLELGLKTNLGASRDIAQDQDRFFNLFEISSDAKLSVPRILLPWVKNDLVPKIMHPQTNLIIGTSYQKNIGLDKQFFTGIYQFDWKPNTRNQLLFKLIDLEFVNNQNISNYFNVYRNSYDRLNSIASGVQLPEKWLDANNNLNIPEGTNAFMDAVLNENTAIVKDSPIYKTVNGVQERWNRLTANNLILGSSFSFSSNSQENIFDETFYQLRWKTDWVGLLLNNFLLKSEEQLTPQSVAFNGVSPSQYVKTELDFIKHWRVGRQRIVAFHFFGGIAIPYGNANDIPFTRSFFSGGANDNRAWKAYKLGPGSSSNINEFNEANFKLAFNLEYRFPLIASLNGAFFADLGNIWNLWDAIEDPAMRFEGWQDLSELALGTGIGLRYDFDFFVIRFDTGFKTYNPALPQSERWGTDMSLRKAVFNIGINYPF